MAWTSNGGFIERLLVRLRGSSVVFESASDGVMARLALPGGTSPRWHALQLQVSGALITPILNGLVLTAFSANATRSRAATDDVSLGCVPTLCAATAAAVTFYTPATEVHLGRLLPHPASPLELRAMQSSSSNVRVLRDESLFFDGESSRMDVATLPAVRGEFTLAFRSKSRACVAWGTGT